MNHFGRRGDNLAGQQFGRLTVVSLFGKDAYKRRMWLCVCACGNEVTVVGVYLRQRNTTSCGCCTKDLAKKNVPRFPMPTTVKHGLFGKHPLYQAWAATIDRCENPNNDTFKSYGGKGIAV